MADLTKEDMRELLAEQAKLLRGNISNTNTGGGGGGSTGGAASSFFATTTNTLTNTMSALAGGTANTTTALNLLTGMLSGTGVIGQAAAKAIGEMGTGVINANNALRESGKTGVAFGGDLGLYNEKVKRAQLTFDEFNGLLGKGNTSMAGLGTSMDKSASAFLEINEALVTGDTGIMLKEAGIQAADLAESTRIYLLTQRGANLEDTKSKAAAVQGAAELAAQLQATAKLTGLSAEKQRQELERQLKKSEIEAMMMQKGTAYADAYAANVTAFQGFGPEIQDLMAEIAVYGAPISESSQAAAAALGNSYSDVVNAVKSIGTSEQAHATQSAKAAIFAQQTSDLNLTNVQRLGDADAANRKVFAGIYDASTIFKKQQEQMEKELGRQVTAMEVMKVLDDKKISLVKEQSPEGAVSRTINQLDNLGKLAGGAVATQFTTLNASVSESINNFNQQNKLLTGQYNTVDKLKNAPKELTDSISKALAGRNAANPADRTQNLRPGQAIPSQAEGSKDTFGDWFGHDFGAGGLSMLHGKEAVVPQAKVGEFINDILKSQSTTQQATQFGNTLDKAADPVMKDIKELLIQLNTQMQKVASNTAETVNLNDKQVRATESLSNNRFV